MVPIRDITKAFITKIRVPSYKFNGHIVGCISCLYHAFVSLFDNGDGDDDDDDNVKDDKLLQNVLHTNSRGTNANKNKQIGLGQSQLNRIIRKQLA